MVRDTIDNNQDVLDSRDIIARIEELEDTQDEDEQAELATLQKLQEEAEGYSGDWKCGATLIRESYFTEYAQELAEDVGDIPRDGSLHWPFTHIDWEAAAEALKQDYTEVDFDGVTYYVR